MKKNYFFVHGGPGFTSKPEEKLIGPLLPANTDIKFWNELSPLRGSPDLSNYFSKNLELLEKDLNKELNLDENLTPIFFSFGLQYLLFLPTELTNRFKKIILIAPSADHNKTDRNIFELALKDFKLSNLDSYHKLQSLVDQLQKPFDQCREDAFLLASTAPTLFTNYFNSEKAMMNYFGNLTGEFGFSVDSFLAIRRSLPLTIPKKMFHNEVTVLFGKADPITPYQDQFQLLSSYFSQLKCFQFDSHKHFLHVENPELLLNCFL